MIAVSIWMGPLITERSLIAKETNPEQYEGFIETLGRRYASGKNLLDEIGQDIDMPDDQK